MQGASLAFHQSAARIRYRCRDISIIDALWLSITVQYPPLSAQIAPTVPLLCHGSRASNVLFPLRPHRRTGWCGKLDTHTCQPSFRHNSGKVGTRQLRSFLDWSSNIHQSVDVTHYKYCLSGHISKAGSERVNYNEKLGKVWSRMCTEAELRS